MIFEDFARFILVENTYEEVVLQTVMKDILQGTGGSAAGWGGGSLTVRGGMVIGLPRGRPGPTG